MVQNSAPDWSFARRPKWVLSHVAVAALVVALIVAGLWQVQRHQDRAERNDTVRERSSVAAVDVAQVLSPVTDVEAGELQYTVVEATGVFQVDDEVLVRNRSLEGAPGYWVLTPLLLDAGWAVTVNRGWIPSSFDPDEPRPGTEPLAGSVTVTGTLQPASVAEGFQRADPAEGRLSSLGRPDVERLDAQVPYDLAPMLLQASPLDTAAAGTLPVPLDVPSLDAGPHASYAAQWFIFTTIALVGYPLVLRRVARGQGVVGDVDDVDANPASPRRGER